MTFDWFAPVYFCRFLFYLFIIFLSLSLSLSKNLCSLWVLSFFTLTKPHTLFFCYFEAHNRPLTRVWSDPIQSLSHHSTNCFFFSPTVAVRFSFSVDPHRPSSPILLSLALWHHVNLLRTAFLFKKRFVVSRYNGMIRSLTIGFGIRFCFVAALNWFFYFWADFVFFVVFRVFFLVMEDRSLNRMNSGMSDVVLGCVMPYIHDPKDRDAVSLVCKRWYELDALTRKHVTIALCYTTSPDRLRRRFRHLESLKLKGKPRAAMFNLIPEDWGGYVTPWVREIAESFNCLKSLHFRRMIVRDSDLELLARTRGRVLLALKLDKCSGFSTDGLLHIGRSCR